MLSMGDLVSFFTIEFNLDALNNVKIIGEEI